MIDCFTYPETVKDVASYRLFHCFHCAYKDCLKQSFIAGTELVLWLLSPLFPTVSLTIRNSQRLMAAMAAFCHAGGPIITATSIHQTISAVAGPHGRKEP